MINIDIFPITTSPEFEIAVYHVALVLICFHFYIKGNVLFYFAILIKKIKSQYCGLCKCFK